MSVKTQAHWECDLCKTPGGTTAAEHVLPLGWIKVATENPYVDRMFTDHALCKNCIEMIIAAAKKRSEHAAVKSAE